MAALFFPMRNYCNKNHVIAVFHPQKRLNVQDYTEIFNYNHFPGFFPLYYTYSVYSSPIASAVYRSVQR